MDRISLKALYVLLISLWLAFVFNFLFFEKLPGISVVIFAAFLLAALFGFGLRQRLILQKVWWIVALLAFFALMPALRANEFLTFLNVCAILGLLMLLAHQLVGFPVFLTRLKDYLVLAVLVPFRMLGAGFSSISLVSQIHSRVQQRDVWLRIVKGVIMAVPLLVLFAVLFSQADLAFSRFINSLVDINISERTAQYMVLLAVAFIAALCFLSYIFFAKPAQPYSSPEQSDEARSGKGIEVMVFLGLIAVLFAVFIGFQITYLFGGEANITNAGFTYAEYARRGFFELLAVTVLSLIVLLAAEKYSGSESKRNSRFLIPALIFIMEIVVIMASAFKRLSLYIDAYGMTLLRFYVAGFILLLAALFILLTVKFIRSKPEQFFTFGTVLSLTGFLMVINLINPDAFIAKANMEQFRQTGKIDVPYLRELSADAAPVKIELYKKLEGEDKEILRGLLEKERDRLQNINAHWQSANVSRSKGLKLLQNFE